MHVHVHPISAWRRLAGAVIAVAIASVFFRGYFAAGLVNRGDDFMRVGKPAIAMLFFRRANWVDPAWDIPVDRMGFAASMSSNKLSMRFGVFETTRFLAAHPESALIRWDRAVCLLHLHMAPEAYTDMRILAIETRGTGNPDARRYADIAYHLGQRLHRPDYQEFAWAERAE